MGTRAGRSPRASSHARPSRARPYLREGAGRLELLGGGAWPEGV